MRKTKKRKIKNKKPLIPEKKSLLSTGVTEEWYFILKCIAILFMVVDHLGWYFMNDFATRNGYLMFRGFGRIAFPIFVFLLIESFYHTKNKKMHLYKLFFLAILSEVPFDYFLSGKIIFPEIQNVILAFAFYFLYLWICEKLQDSLSIFQTNEKDKKGREKLKIGFVKIKKETVTFLIKFDLAALLYIFCEVCRFDYAGQGVVLLFLLDFARGRKHFFLWQIFAFCTFIVCREERINLMALIGLIPLWISQLSVFKTKRMERVLKISKTKVAELLCRYFYPIHFLVFCATTLMMKGA